ncbi:hypothetical protein GCM10010331_45430 [Streptomyces xanthochromogenes]|nr:hypothetical protein GCM10010331_45430 [Streptomyces xanthochromogenes]
MTVLTNSARTQARVDSGDIHLDQRGRTSQILKSRFASDCYRLVQQNNTLVNRLPTACIDYGRHAWHPTRVMTPFLQDAAVILVCTKCSAHTARASRYIPDAVLDGDLAA